ncbi:MAG TPA: GGDEF domain-containing protein, partial [Acidimicrobiales bacterium]|nr:GGDEF domain-containing protein [Acidimicrobiales bacterium]
MADATPANGSAGAGGRPVDLAGWLARWVEATDAGDLPLPGEEARQVLAAVLVAVSGEDYEAAERVGRAWGRAHRSVSVLVRRLSALRGALVAGDVEQPMRMHQAIDRVTADATEEVMRRLEHASRTDPLTGVGNRRAFEETLSAALSAATRQGHEITVVEVDLDGLKRLNDDQGHAAGDAALLALVRAFYAALRDEDTVFRVGGDEFMILLPFTSAEDAAVLMERVAAGDAPPFTWGASGFPGDAAEAIALVAAADQDLYRRRH